LVVLAAAATAALTGCGAEDRQASTELPPMASSSAESTPELPPLGPADLPMPEEARQRTPEGARAFMTYYLEVYNHALSTLDATHLIEMSANCRTCQSLAEQVKGVASDGFAYKGGAVRIDAMSAPVVKGDEAQLAFSLLQEDLSIVSNGAPAEGRTYPERRSPSSGAILRWDSDRGTWLMTQLDVQ
jgi:hypothetical protein